jgi:hypothetical protein
MSKEKYVPKSYWVIFSKKRNTIFERTFPTYEEATAELEFQMATIGISERAHLDWVIEERTN